MSTTTASSQPAAQAKKRSKPPRENRQIDYPMVGLWIALVLVSLIWFLPFVFMVLTSLKTPEDVSTSSIWALPTTWAWNNYADAADRGDLWTVLRNSLFIAVIKVPLGLLISAAAAFALSRLKFRLNKVVLLVLAAGAMIPVQVALAPMFKMMSSLNMLDSTFWIILPYLAFGIPYQIFFLYGFFTALPRELDEAARIDGAGNVRLFFQVLLPLAKPALAALFILDFVATWNEYGMALTLLQDNSVLTVPLAMQNFQSQFSTAYGQLNAFIIMSILPVLIVYLMFQRFFTSGGLAGAVKG